MYGENFVFFFINVNSHEDLKSHEILANNLQSLACEVRIYLCLTAVPFVGCVYTVVFAVADEAPVHTSPVTAPELPRQANRRIYRTIKDLYS
jgi:hypothetical protein